VNAKAPTEIAAERRADHVASVVDAILAIETGGIHEIVSRTASTIAVTICEDERQVGG
jgi:hypothetical protein